MPRPDSRRFLLDCFQAALAAVDARRCVREQLVADAPTGPWHVVAIGKAAGAMSLGAADCLGTRLASGLVVTKAGHVPAELQAMDRLRVIESAHPMPDQRSTEAGRAVVEFVTGLPGSAQVLFLVSGGASSLVEWLVPGITLADLRAVNEWALTSGRPITEVNAVRRRLSRLKGGGLAGLGGSRRMLAMMISDVPRDDPAVIGSGLLHWPRTAGAVTQELPAEIAAMVERATRARPAPAGVPEVPCRVVASIRQACRAAGEHASSRGVRAGISRTRFAGDATRLGRRFAGMLIGRAPAGTLHVWGGESTVVLPLTPGHGGRNQHLALSAALVLAGRDSIALLAAGTDGVDGVTDDAGAIVDGGTCERGRDAGYDPDASLALADSGRFLEGSGDLLHTGPTLTNVGDLVLGFRG